MADSSKPAKNQILQMVNFILQEAHEKANEIQVKSDHDFTLEKQLLVREAKQRINAEYSQKERDREVQQRIDRADKITKAKTEKMRERQTLVEELLETCRTRLIDSAKGPTYAKSITGLIIQAMHKLEDETVYEVCCRKEDQGMVNKAITQAVSAFPRKGITCTLSGKVIPSEITPGIASGPGVVVIAKDGSIVCDNTLGARLALVFMEQLPQIRKGLFP